MAIKASFTVLQFNTNGPDFNTKWELSPISFLSPIWVEYLPMGPTAKIWICAWFYFDSLKQLMFLYKGPVIVTVQFSIFNQSTDLALGWKISMYLSSNGLIAKVQLATVKL